MLDYIEQWNRLKKYYQKVLQIESYEQSCGSDECLEEMYLFFENCLKLRDWLRNSSHVGQDTQRRVIKLFEEDRDLSACVGLANRRKHLKPDNRKKYGDSSVVSHLITVQVPVVHVSRVVKSQPPSSTKAKYNWGLKSGGEEFELINLAKICMKKLEQFMLENKLIVS